MSTCSGFKVLNLLSYWLNDPFTNCIFAWYENVEKCFCEQVYCIYMLWNADVRINEWVMKWDILPLINVTQALTQVSSIRTSSSQVYFGPCWSDIRLALGNTKPFWMVPFTLNVSLFKVKPVSFCRGIFFIIAVCLTFFSSSSLLLIRLWKAICVISSNFVFKYSMKWLKLFFFCQLLNKLYCLT